jgi:hypothetical protein
MQIKMNTTVSGPGIFYARNQVYDLPKAKAQELLAARFATTVPATPAAKREKAIQKSRETR